MKNKQIKKDSTYYSMKRMLILEAIAALVITLIKENNNKLKNLFK